MPKNNGGLGLVSLQKFNKALLGKWVYGWYGDRDKGWNVWLRNNYQCEKGASLEECFDRSNPSGIVKMAKEDSTSDLFRNSQYEWKVNDGKKVIFWEDTWIQDLWDFYEHTGTTFWKRSLRSWEIEQVECLNEILKGVALNSRKVSLLWLPGLDMYTVKKATSLLDLDRSENRVGWFFIWRLKIPPKVQIFVWKLCRGILPVKVFLYSRLGSSIGSTSCLRCNEDKSINHLLWQCDFVKMVMKLMLEWWGLSNLRMIADFDTMWESCRLFKELIMKEIWKTTLCACIWTIWLERNQRVFEHKESSVDNVMFWIKHRSAQWCLAAGFLVSETLNWWTVNPMGCITRSRVLKTRELLNSGSVLSGFIDGSWKLDSNWEIVAGIGDLILDQERKKGVVCRNSRGDILRILGGSLGIVNMRNNEYHTFMEGLKVAFDRGYTDIILESDHLDAYWDWTHSSVFGAPV
ncbi:hypothetical protein POM88_040422 [Heracleum sosnowskyi]|uniref:Reverse transcriptase zinc-binding domain-containing protein n=1 Tax=Heracleum sosnowskyi TaxID=360622 RepID=A0AAD8M8R6_9APIA|nr:hypothetical protein POM88_040422 [Heracleum sosnowskyi]